MTEAAKDGATYDFRAPKQIADDVDSMLTQWHAQLGRLVSEGWQEELGLGVQWEHQDLDTTTLAAASDQFTTGEPAFVFATVGYEGLPKSFLFAIPRPLLVGALATLLGDDVEEMPEDRALTDIELSVVEIGFQQLAQAMTDGQPCDKPLVCEFRELLSERDCTSNFSEQDPLVLSRFRMTASFGEQVGYCLIAQESILELLTRVAECKPNNDGANKIQDTLRELPVGMVVRLGTTEVHVSELMKLQPGDVLMLNQRVAQPLSMDIGKQTKFRGWPGRVGNRQAFQVSEVVVEET